MSVAESEKVGAFWRLPRVVEETGRSKSDIYRMIARGVFPRSRPYPGSRSRFWYSIDVENWKRNVVEFGALG